MLEAKAMYLGGDIVKAEECNYESYKKLGLKCPCCNEAVYLCKGEKRKAYFSHYEGKENECELRINRINKKIKEEIRIKAKGQRLKIYNKHLWKIINTYGRVDKKEFTDNEVIKIINKLFNKKELNNLSKEIRNNFKLIKYENDYYKKLLIELLKKNNVNKYIKNTEELIKENNINKNTEGLIEEKNVNKYREIIKRKKKELKEEEEIYKYLREVYKSIEKIKEKQAELEWHCKVCNEVTEYLKTKVSKYIWNKLSLLIIHWFILVNKDIKEVRKRINYEISNHNIIKIISEILVLTNWRNIIDIYY